MRIAAGRSGTGWLVKNAALVAGAAQLVRQLGRRPRVRLNEVDQPPAPGVQGCAGIAASLIDCRGGHRRHAAGGRRQRGLQDLHEGLQRAAVRLAQGKLRAGAAGKDFFDARCRVTDGPKTKGAARARQFMRLRQRCKRVIGVARADELPQRLVQRGDLLRQPGRIKRALRLHVEGEAGLRHQAGGWLA